MILCKNCNSLIVKVLSFSKDKYEKFYQCPKCRGKTKHFAIKDSELNFGEILHKEINNRNR